MFVGYWKNIQYCFASSLLLIIGYLFFNKIDVKILKLCIIVNYN